MTVYIVGFIVAVVLAVLVIIWIAYCMFIRERHKSEFFQYNISDLERRNYVMNMNDDSEPDKKGIATGVFVLPSKHKQNNEEYNKRPDYPESPAPVSHHSTDKLIDMLDPDVHYRKCIVLDSQPPSHSEV